MPKGEHLREQTGFAVSSRSTNPFAKITSLSEDSLDATDYTKVPLRGQWQFRQRQVPQRATSRHLGHTRETRPDYTCPEKISARRTSVLILRFQCVDHAPNAKLDLSNMVLCNAKLRRNFVYGAFFQHVCTIDAA